MKVVMAAPFDTLGRYAGGIMSVANTLYDQKQTFNDAEIEIIRFNTCRVKRQPGKLGAFNLLNVKNAVKIYVDLTKTVKKEKSDVVYFHTSVNFALLKDLFAIRRVKKKTGVKTIVHIHFADFDQIISKKWIEKSVLNILKKYVDKIIFLSKTTRKQFVDHGLDADKCAVLYNFSALNFSEKELNIRNKQRDKTHFLFVGSIDERKGIFDVLKCLENTESNYVLHVCGTAPDDELQKKFDYYKDVLGENLKYHGYVSGADKKKIFCNADILLLPSYGEGMPIVILEAFSAGLAVVSTDVGAIPEILSNESGKCIAAGDNEMLAKVLNEYMLLPEEELNKQKLYNYEIAKKYTVVAFVKQVISIFKE